jgi:hypothetical protein
MLIGANLMPNIPVTADSFRRIRIQNTNQNVVADSSSDMLTLIAGEGITISADEATDAVTIRAVATLSTAGLDDILFNGNTSSIGITVGQVIVDNLTLEGSTITALSGNDISLSVTGGGRVVLTGDILVNHIIPNSDSNFDIGTTAQKFRNIYLSGSSSIFFGNINLGATQTGINLPSGSSFNNVPLSLITVPDPTGQQDEFLRSNGTSSYWGALPDVFPSRTGQGGKFLYTDGTNISWNTPTAFNGGTITDQLTVQNDVLITGALTVNGATTIITSQTLEVTDKNIELGITATPTDITADGGGITLKGASDKTITWLDSNDSWNFSHNIVAPYFSGAVEISAGNIINISSLRFVTGVTVNDISNDPILADAATTALPTEFAVKSYVDNKAVLINSTYANPAFITDLAINQGGTGARSATDALNNLLPSGEQAGYVLKTNGPGSYFWASELGASAIVGNRITTSRTTFTATAGQTVFTGVGSYTIGSGQLRVYVDGVRQFPSAYTETSTTSFTLLTGVSDGAQIMAEVDGYIDFTVLAQAVTFDNTGTGLSAIDVQNALVELNTEKANLSSPTFTGTVSGITASMVGLGNVANESKATMFTSPTFTGTVSGITASMVGLGNVENTALSTWTGSNTITTLGTVTVGSAPASDVYAWAKQPAKPTYTASEVGLANVTNESKATMFTSPTFTGTVTMQGATQLKEVRETIYALATTSGIITPDAANGSIQTVTLTGSITFNGFSNPIAGQSLTLVIKQPASGGPYTLTSSMAFANGSKTLSTAANTTDMISVTYLGGTTYLAALSKGFV